MKEKILGVVMSLLMVFSLFPATNVSADVVGELEIIIKADKETAQPGDIITYTVSIGAVEHMAYAEFWMDIPEGLTLEKGSMLMSAAEQNALKELFKAIVVDEETGESVEYQAQMAETIERNGDNKFVTAGADYSSSKEQLLFDFQCKVDDDYTGNAVMTLKDDESYAGNVDDDSYTLKVKDATVKVSVPVTGVTVTPAAIELKREGATASVSAVIAPENATNKKVSYSSDNTNVATVNAETGLVTAVANGTATITATTEDGSFKATCEVTVNIPHEHTMEPVAATDSTCTKQGNEAYFHCTGCDKYFEDEAGEEETTPEEMLKQLLPHTEKTPASCKELAVCDVCGNSYGEYAPHVLHENPAKAADHNNTGNIRYWDCTVCEKLFSDEAGMTEITPADTVIAKVPHSYGVDWENDDAKHWKECGCGAIAEEAAHAMDWVVDIKPTEETEGLQHKECTVCGYVDESTKDTVMDKLTHELVKVEAKEATHQEAGNIEYWSCKNCDNIFKDADAEEMFDSVEDVVIPQIPHTFDMEKWTADEKNHYHACACGEGTDVAAHTFGEWTVKKAATATEAGSKERTCTVCAYKETQTIAAIGTVGGGDSNGGQGNKNPAGSQLGNSQSPYTGDDNMWLLTAFLVVGLGAAGVTVGIRRRKSFR